MAFLPFFSRFAKIMALAALITILFSSVVTDKYQAATARYQVATYSNQIVDTSRNRPIPYKIYYPANLSAPAPLVIVSHGGVGNPNGRDRLQHLGTEYAAAGYVAIHLSHYASSSRAAHLRDRPKDVSFIIDNLSTRTLPLPAGFRGKIDLGNIAHVGHSTGAYTSIALAGGTFTQGVFRDSRIKVSIPISPQGQNQFGSFYNSPSDNTWITVKVPTYSLVGSLEKDGPRAETMEETDWRLQPFWNFPKDLFHINSVLPGANHNNMGNGGTPAQSAFIATNSRAFLDVFLQGKTEQLCQVGYLAPIKGVLNQRRYPPKKYGDIMEKCPDTSLSPLYRLAYTHPYRLSQASVPVKFFGNKLYDLFIASKGNIHVIRNQGNGKFSHGGTWKVDNANGWGLHDFNRDGSNDLFIAQQQRPQQNPDVRFLYGNGTLKEVNLGNETLLPARLVLFDDFNGDGFIDSYHSGSFFRDNHHWNELHYGVPGGKFDPKNRIDSMLSNRQPSFWHEPAQGPNGCAGEWAKIQFKGAVVRDFNRDGKGDIVTTAYADRGFQDRRCEDYAREWVNRGLRGIFVFQNVSSKKGQIRFEDVSLKAIPNAYGTGGKNAMNPYHATPIDFDSDGDFDLVVGLTVRPVGRRLGYEDTPALLFYRNDSVRGGDIKFTEITDEVGLGEINKFPPNRRTLWNFAAGMQIDYDNDGYVDIALVNRQDPSTAVSPNVHIYRNIMGKRFELIEYESHNVGDGSGGRDATYHDLNGDGCLDISLNDGNNGGFEGLDSTRIYLNQCQWLHNWLELSVVDSSGSPVIGSKVSLYEANTGRFLAIEELRADFSYRSKRDTSVHFGLGAVAKVYVEVEYPWGRTQQFPITAVNQRLTLSASTL